MKLIPLTQGKFAKVDDEDFDSASKLKWSAHRFGNTFYAVRKGPVYLHRFLMGDPVGMLVDHKNHDGLDCRRENMRVCTKGQNQMNRRGPTKKSTSGIRGVYWQKSLGKWAPRIQVNGKLLSLGVFHSKDEAAAAYAAANLKYFGEFGGGL